MVFRTALHGIFAVLGLVVCYFLLKGVRWLWLVMVVATAVYFVGFLLELGMNAIPYFVALVLLLAAPTRRHFAREGVAAA